MIIFFSLYNLDSANLQIFFPARCKADNEVAESVRDWFCLTLVFSIYSHCHCPLDIFVEVKESAPFMY